MIRPARRLSLLLGAALLAGGCAPVSPAPDGAAAGAASGTAAAATIDPASGAHPGQPVANAPFTMTRLVGLAEPWAMTFLPGSDRALVTLKAGAIKLVEPNGTVRDVAGAPRVAYGGQGGLGDIIVAPGAGGADPTVYLSWVEAGPNNSFGAVVGRARLALSGPGGPALVDLAPIWRQSPKVTGRGHFSHRLALAPDAGSLYVTSGDRQKFDPAQDMGGNLGKVLRLTLDGKPFPGNPYAAQGGVAAEAVSIGHRNLLGMTFAPDGALWTHEMGPANGDELNRIEPGQNYGWPRVSNGEHYDGRDIPDHAPGDGFRAPDLFWHPAISPAGLTYHGGGTYAGWTQPSLLIGALGGESLVRVVLTPAGARKAERWETGMRVREVETGRDGRVYLLSDGDDGALYRLDPKR